VRRLLWPGIAALAGLALAPVAHAQDVKVGDVAKALEEDPVYVAPSQRRAVSASAERRLRRRIARLAPGRLQIAVVPQASADRVGGIRSFANAVDQRLPGRKGSLLATTGRNFQIVTSHTGVNPTLAAVRTAVNDHRDDLTGQLLASVDGIAEVDPGPGADVNGPPPSGDSSPVPSTPTPTSTSTSGSDIAEIVGLVVLGLILLPLLFLGGFALLRWRRKRRESSQLLELDLGSTRDQLLALGQEIQDLDLDTQMPNASPAGIHEYEQAMQLYDRANRALADEEPSQVQIYEAKRAAEEGRKHVRAARNLLTAPPGGETVHPSP
jgi:hypothetical protein